MVVMKLLQAEIAGLKVQIDPADGAFFHRRFAAYMEPFETPDLLIRSEFCHHLSVPDRPEMVRTRNSMILQGDNGFLIRVVLNPESKDPVTVIRFNANYTVTDIQILRERKGTTLTATDFEYVYSGEMFQNRLVMLGGLVLHASSIIYKGRGIAFSANSGTGKSTHTDLWRKLLGSEITYINDDKPAIRFLDGVPNLFGTPWSGKTDINHNISAPLHAIVFIERAEQNTIKRLSAADSIYQVITQVSRPYYDREVGIRALDAVERLVESVPIYLLSCNMSEDAVHTVLNELF